jgi:predicted flavoprotein YhiN
LSKESYLNTESIAQNIKSFIYKYYILHPLTRQFLQLEDLKAVSENFELATMPNQFCIGEMLDWDAPTGGLSIAGCKYWCVFSKLFE